MFRDEAVGASRGLDNFVSEFVSLLLVEVISVGIAFLQTRQQVVKPERQSCS